jgi:hypothetical protein
VLDEAYQKRIVDDYLDFSDLSKDQIEYYFNRMKEFVKLIDGMITERLYAKIIIICFLIFTSFI